jgi:peptidoglycan biosynthesis protein MviN/MurJ (putative lipid II flippase)
MPWPNLSVPTTGLIVAAVPFGSAGAAFTYWQLLERKNNPGDFAPDWLAVGIFFGVVAVAAMAKVLWQWETWRPAWWHRLRDDVRVRLGMNP